MNIDEMIEVLEAYKEGRKIECFSKSGSQGWGPAGVPCWDFFHYDYRVKQEPREVWVIFFDDGSLSVFKKGQERKALEIADERDAKIIRFKEVIE